MRTLMVTPFAPYRDGIATYALQELRRLRQDGEEVDVLSPLPSAARHHLKLGGPTGMVQLGNVAANYERTVVQFGPELAFGSCRSAGHRVAAWTALAALARRTSLDLRIHEIEYGPLEQNPLERRAARLALGQADRVTVHTEAERSMLNEVLGFGRRIEIIEHGRDFQPAVTCSKADARAELGLSADQVTFVAIGFLQHHKGFDRAVAAMQTLGASGAHLHIVGSARVNHPDIEGYVDQLAAMCARTPSATLHQQFVSDVVFDLWLQAADAVVLPYREIWSSGVVERARLFATPIIASELPQLRDQAPADAMFFNDTDQLASILNRIAQSIGQRSGSIVAGTGDHPSGGPSVDLEARGDDDLDLRSWTVDPERLDRDAVQAQVRSRARAAELSSVDDLAGDVVAAAGVDRRALDPLLALGHLHRPQPTSARPGVAPVKRLIERLTGWQIDPLANRIEHLQRATVEAVALLDRPAGEASQPSNEIPASPQLPARAGNDKPTPIGGSTS